MSFKNFLIESYKDTVTHVILQKIVDHLDHGHIEYSKNKTVINVGKLTKDASFYNLFIVIRKAKEDKVKLGKNKLDDKIYIVIDTTYYPQRQNFHKLFVRENVVKGFEKEFPRYMKKYHQQEEHSSKTGHETGKEVNTKKSFEKNFSELQNKINDSLKEYKAAAKELKSSYGRSALPSHKAAYEAAVERLKKDSVGTSAKEFVSKMMKLADKKYLDHMDTESKKKLTNRLTSYYEHHFVTDDLSESFNSRREDMPYGVKPDLGDDTAERDGPYPNPGEDDDGHGPDAYIVVELTDGQAIVYDDGEVVTYLNRSDIADMVKDKLIDPNNLKDSLENYYYKLIVDEKKQQHEWRKGEPERDRHRQSALDLERYHRWDMDD